MINYPRLKAGIRSRQVVDVFKGYNHSPRIGSGEFYEMENLTSDEYPVLSVRKKRGVVRQLKYGCKGMLYVPGKGLFYLEQTGGNSILYLLSPDGTSTEITKLNPAYKRFALIGKRLVMVPDMRWVDIDSLETGPIGETWGPSGSILILLCDAEGNTFGNVTIGADPPSEPGYHAHWLCNVAGRIGLWKYEPASAEWVSIPSTYLRIVGLGDHPFKAGDGVEISGMVGNAAALNGSHVIQKTGPDLMVIPGIIFGTHDQTGMTIKREPPKLDFVVECGNRLWGCTKTTNEIYACKLGDPFNWNCSQGLSTDSWVGSVGTPGEFTGAVVQNGYPIFYKENGKHKVWPSASGAHQITFVPCDGVQKGCENSLAVREGTVFYRSPVGVCADDGGGPAEIGQCLGEMECEGASGAVFDKKYYIAMKGKSGERNLFVYDLEKRLWHREDDAPFDNFTSGGGSLYGGMDKELWDLSGGMGETEEAISWMAVTGDLGLELPEQKYISRLTLRLCLDPGATLEIYAQYDREQTWVKLGQVYGTDLRSFSLPVRPRRCDQLRLKLQGTGMCKIYSITKTLEKGSELA